MTWLELLNSAVDRFGRREVEKRLGISKATLSQVLNQKYPGNMGNIETLVLEQFSVDLNTEMDCPVLGEISRDRCLREQVKPLIATNPTRVKLWQTCRTCPNKCQGKK